MYLRIKKLFPTAILWILIPSKTDIQQYNNVLVELIDWFGITFPLLDFVEFVRAG